LVTLIQRDAVIWTQPIAPKGSYYAISIGEKVARKKSADPVDALAIPNNEDLQTGQNLSWPF
jgi:hypothetical protein